MTDPEVQALAAEVPALVAEAKQLNARIEKGERSRTRMIRLIVVLLLAVGVMVFLLLSGRSQSRATLRTILDCTTVGTPAAPHRCYEDGRSSQAKAVGQINRQGALDQVEITACEMGARGDVTVFRGCVARLPGLRTP